MLTARTAPVVALAVVAVAVTAPACAPSRAGGAKGGASVAPAPVSPTMSFPAGATVVDGATATLKVPARQPGTLFVDVSSQRTPRGTTVTLRVIRDENCRIDKADPQAHLYVCTTTFDRRKTLPAGAFTFDGALGAATLSTTVAGQPLRVTWTGYGGTRRQVNENGALLIEARDAQATASWGRVRHVDDRASDVKSSLYRRVTA